MHACAAASATLSPSAHWLKAAGPGGSSASRPREVLTRMAYPGRQFPPGTSTRCTLALTSSRSSSPFTPCAGAHQTLPLAPKPCDLKRTPLLSCSYFRHGRLPQYTGLFTTPWASRITG